MGLNRVAMMAYKIRVMLSHIWETCACLPAGAKHPEAFEEAFAILATPQESTPQNNHRRSERLGSQRPHLCLNYQAQADEVPDEEATEHTIVSKYFDGKQALLLKADGSISVADSYREGPSGCIIATWTCSRL